MDSFGSVSDEFLWISLVVQVPLLALFVYFFNRRLMRAPMSKAAVMLTILALIAGLVALACFLD